MSDWPRCKRCGGQLYADSDEYGTYVCCLSCGATTDTEREKRRPDDADLDDGPKRPDGRRDEAVRRRMAGEPEALVAADLGVTPRTVRYWCQGVEGIKRDDGRRWRKTIASVLGRA